MRNDLYLGVLVSIGLHSAVAFIDRGPVRLTRLVKDEPPVIRLVQRPLDVDEPVADVTDEKPKPTETVSRPTLDDFPKTLKPGDFSTPVQPPVPETSIDRGLVTILPGNSGRFGPTAGVFVIADLDRSPLARFQASPEYPFDMRRSGISGEVLVEFIVDANGAVRDAHAVRSSQREFEASAVRAVSKWTFRAGEKGGRSVATRMQVPIVFNLNEARE